MGKPFLVAGLFGFLAVIAPSPASAGFIINPDFTDPAWQAENTASAGALDAAVNSAVSIYEHLYTNNVTVNIAFQWGGAVGGSGGGAAASPTLEGFYTLAQTEALFTAHAALHPENTVINTAVQHLPATLNNPNSNGTNGFAVTSAEQAALTGVSPAASDGTIGFGTSSTSGFWNAFALHEIGHILGRADYAFAGLPFLTPLDFFKYDPNTTTLDPTFTITNFSYDGGATNPGGRQWSNTSDSGDWIGFPSDPYNWETDGTAVLSSTDILLNEALGWDPAASTTPEPASITLLASGFFAVSAFGLYRRRGKAGSRPAC